MSSTSSTAPNPAPPRSRTPWTGMAQCAAGMTFVGASLPVSATLTEYPVFGGQALRYALAAAILLVVLRCSSATWVRVPVREWLRAALVSGVGLVAFSICVVEAARHVEPSVIGAVVGVSPIVFSLTGPLAERRRIRPQLVLAAATVCVGVVLVTGGGTGSVVGFLFATGALAGEVGFSLLAVPLLKRVSPLQLSAMACLCAPPLLILAGLTRPGELLRMPTPAEAAAIGYLAVVVTAVSFVCWYSGLRALGPERAGLFSGLMPIAALSTSVLLGQEGLSPLGLTGSVLVGLGICLGLSRYPHTPVPRSRARSCSSRT